MYDNPPYYLTAYGLAVKRGFTGTLDEWLASLVGPQGPQGVGFVLLGSYATEAELRSAHPTGKAGDCYKVGTGEEETVFYWDPEKKDWESVRVMGPTGQAGKDGATGPAGADGTSVTHSWNGTTLTVTSASGTSSADLQGKTGENGANGNPGPAGADGMDGTTFIPNVSEAGVLSWTNDGGLTNPEPVDIKGPPGKDGAAGNDGADGKSAYQVAVDSGFTGTETEWLASLKGADGTSFSILGRYSTLDELMAAHPIGSEGDAWAVGSAADNDIYLWDVDAVAWTNIGSMQGPEGPTGKTGADGVGIQSVVRTSGDGSPGTTDTYTITLTNGATSTFSVYNGANGAAGPAGEDGTSFSILGRYSTLDELMAAHPTGSEGDAWAVGSTADNDIYLWDVDTAAWTNIGSLQGPPGPPGPAGQDGADGGPGPAGADGPDGANGATFTPAVSQAGVLSFTNDGGLPNPEPVNIKGPPGTGGKTAYQYAVDGGYTGTEEEFKVLMGSGPWLPLSGGELSGQLSVPGLKIADQQNSQYDKILGTHIVKDPAIAIEGTSTDAVIGVVFQQYATKKLAVRGVTAEGTYANLPILIPLTPTQDNHAASKHYVDTSTFSIASNAGAHNSIFRGKNLGTAVSAAQYAAIAAGTFDDLFIGDYWVINGINWRIAAFDYYLGTGSTALTTHHAVIVPDTKLDTQKMNDTNVTTGGYVGSKMYTNYLATARTKVNTAFSGHVLTHQFYLSNAVTNGKVTGSTTVNQDVVLMSERNVYGKTIMSSECAIGSDNPGWNTYDRTQFPLFALAPEFIQKGRSYYWLRDVVNASAFAIVYPPGGAATWDRASYSCGVRPAFSIS